MTTGLPLVDMAAFAVGGIFGFVAHELSHYAVLRHYDIDFEIVWLHGGMGFRANEDVPHNCKILSSFAPITTAVTALIVFGILGEMGVMTLTGTVATFGFVALCGLASIDDLLTLADANRENSQNV